MQMLVLRTFKNNYVIVMVLLCLLMMWQPRVMLTWRPKLFLYLNLHVLGAGVTICLVVSFCLKSKTLTWN